MFMKKDVFHSPLIFFHISIFYFIQEVSMQVNSRSSLRYFATQCRLPNSDLVREFEFIEMENWLQKALDWIP